jgi:O-antigen/teichoic acid export membrane protein
LPILIPFVFGNAYAEAIIICQILVIGSLFINAKTVLGGGIMGMGFPEIMSYVEVVGMIILLIFSVLMIKFYRLIGVSIATSFSYICQFMGLLFLINRKGITYKKMLFTSRNELNDNLNWLKNTTKYFK